MARSWSLTGTQMVPILLMRVAVLLTSSSWVVWMTHLCDRRPRRNSSVMSRTWRRLRPIRERRRGRCRNNETEMCEMTKVTCDMAGSVDGFTAGPNQSVDKPFGDGPVERLTQWMFEQPEANAAQIDAIVAAGAFIMGRHMFGPDRGEWDESWAGWGGDEGWRGGGAADPPSPAPVSPLAPRPREPLEMQGGTTFTFVTDGIESA